jgi:hypothetical protein
VDSLPLLFPLSSFLSVSVRGDDAASVLSVPSEGQASALEPRSALRRLKKKKKNAAPSNNDRKKVIYGRSIEAACMAGMA